MPSNSKNHYEAFANHISEYVQTHLDQESHLRILGHESSVAEVFFMPREGVKRRGWCFAICYRLLFANTTTIVINYYCCHWLYSVGVAHFSHTKSKFPALKPMWVFRKHLFCYKQKVGIKLIRMLPISQLSPNSRRPIIRKSVQLLKSVRLLNKSVQLLKKIP